MIRLYFFFTLLTLITAPVKVSAHGANIEYRETTAITIEAKYDDGMPMANAQVVVYAPSDRATPWLKGTTDESGNFTFVPDTEEKNIGDWDIKVRGSGHGDITSIPILGDEQNPGNTMSSNNGSGYTSAQKAVMAAAVGWGFVGTALYASRSKSSKLS